MQAMSWKTLYVLNKLYKNKNLFPASSATFNITIHFADKSDF